MNSNVNPRSRVQGMDSVAYTHTKQSPCSYDILTKLFRAHPPKMPFFTKRGLCTVICRVLPTNIYGHQHSANAHPRMSSGEFCRTKLHTGIITGLWSVCFPCTWSLREQSCFGIAPQICLGVGGERTFW